MVMGYWSVAILFWQLSIDHIVTVQCKRCGFGKTRLRHRSLPFDSLPYPTRTIRRRVRSVNHVTTKGKEVDQNLWVWGSVPRALRARGSLAIIACDHLPVSKMPKTRRKSEENRLFQKTRIQTMLDKSPWDSTGIFIFFCYFSVLS